MNSAEAVTVDDLARSQTREAISRAWDAELIPLISRYIEIPAKSPLFDPHWLRHGYIEQVVCDAAAWIETKKIAGLKLEVIRLDGRTPLLFFDVPATSEGGNTTAAPCICFYGHLDKQPEFDGWRSDLGPWTPKLKDNLLYGRGGADDGYSIYSAITAIDSVDASGMPRPRCVGIFECSEESGSTDLPAYIDALRPRLRSVRLVICLDSGAGNYDQLWLTTSLRGMVTGVLKVEILEEGVHSGDSGGLVPSSFRILRHILDRLEDSSTGRLLPSSFHCDVPVNRYRETRQTATALGDQVWNQLPWACGGDGGFSLPTTKDPMQALLRRTWHPSLSVIGAEGLPKNSDAGNVLRPYTSFKLSLRLPPLINGHQAAVDLKTLLEDNAPYNAKVSFVADPREGGALGTSGWNAPDLEPWLEGALHRASQAYFGEPCGFIGQGGTIPLISILGEQFPSAQMMICGVLGPRSNAHGPNEFLHIPYAKKLTCALTSVLTSFVANTLAAKPIAEDHSFRGAI
jgi:acetylornithine deacetylase/succinyl-diaminopimelate desuccinylase-like protein